MREFYTWDVLKMQLEATRKFQPLLFCYVVLMDVKNYFIISSIPENPSL